MPVQKIGSGLRCRRAIVTGGAGFLGSYVCERLIAEGLEVVCLDNLLTGSIKNIAHLMGRSSFRFIEGDVRTDLPQEQCDEIWNLASPASPPQYQSDPIGTLLINVVGMAAVLELGRKYSARVFQASTSEVYGDPEVTPQSEDYRGAVNPTGPRACYDEGKRAAEALCFDYIRAHGLDVRVARIFNTYGPRMDPKDGRVVSNFVFNALAGRPLEVYGDGSQTRSFCYCDDLIEGFFRLMRHPQRISGPINIGNPIEFTIRQVAELVREMTGSRSQIVARDLPVDDPKQRRPDISLAMKHLGWQPRLDLREGLTRMIAHFAEVQNETAAGA